MPMDGFTLSYMRRELLSALRGGRVDKVNQPERSYAAAGATTGCF